MRSNYKEITDYNITQLGLDTKSRKSQVNIYSDSTHFIFEILQNADDYGATEITFELDKNQLTIIHNGTPFNNENVKAVTYFGASTSEPDLVKTGRFGIGFKSVFTFTASPIIVSGSESFRIYDLYKIEEYHNGKDLGDKTQIILPFNHLELKPDYVEELLSPELAYAKIEAKLHSLDLLCLLFTKNLRTIKWNTVSKFGEYKRMDTTQENYRTSILSSSKGQKSFIVFSHETIWDIKNYKPVEVAFQLNKNIEFIHSSSPLFVLFPTILDTHLKFIINGPFRTKPSRESIAYDDLFNQHIIHVICILFEKILKTLKSENLINGTFLNILPLPNDNVNDFFAPIKNIVYKNFKFNYYIPTSNNSFTDIYNARIVFPKLLSNFFSREDIMVFQNNPDIEILPDISKKTRAYEFLINLGLKEWSWSDLNNDLKRLFNKKIFQTDSFKSQAIDWLWAKPDDWLLEFYSLLASGVDSNKLGESHFDNKTYDTFSELNSIYIIKCTLHETFYFDEAPSVKFPKEGYTGVLFDGLLNKSKDNYAAVIKTFKSLGVKEINEEDEIQIILSNYYYQVWSTGFVLKTDIAEHIDHVKKFSNFYKKNTNTTIFNNYKIFLSEEEKLYPSELLYLDTTFKSTGLNKLYKSEINLDKNKNSLWEGYKDVYNDSFLNFIQMMGVEDSLAIISHPIHYNPLWNQLRDGMYGNDGSQYKVEEDFSILNLKSILSSQNFDILKLLWSTLDSMDPKYFYAKYRINSNFQIRKVPSYFITLLSSSNWIPDQNGNLCIAKDISADLLHTDFQNYKNSSAWLELIGFGKNVKLKSEKEAEKIKSLKELGFNSIDEYNDLLLVKKKLGNRPLSSILQYIPDNQELPEKAVSDIEDRRSKIKKEFNSAGDISFTVSNRHLRDSKRSVSPLIKKYLTTQYTNSLGILICQICHLSMPFKVDNQYYFESVEIFKDQYIVKESDKPHLALCPNCAAKYKYLVKPHDNFLEDIKWAIKEMSEDEEHYIKIKNANIEMDIYFTRMHILDLKVILDEIE